MLVMLSGDPRGDDDLVRIVPRFVLGQDVGVDDPRSLDFELDGTSEVEGEVEPVLPVTSTGSSALCVGCWNACYYVALTS
jgi:hypothetical protein